MKNKTKATTDVKAEVKALDNRVNSLAGTQRFMCSVQMDQLEKAEKLRKLAMALTYCVSDSKLSALVAFARTLSPFSIPARKLAKMRIELRKI